ncbi:methyltransferase domain-containing protein [Oerskovia rustica]|uniref:Methyltransferase domain-containing protein n=1 Tax=Oerskovia rustica TaxID=2762237 RepID=A0ABR8RMX3_9CELL|nr:methyltransferase domain-containing protein [Oerskovia rustica]MBD7949130.1 methyltransferase domain-containing protein [Oerskovia rustica]
MPTLFEPSPPEDYLMRLAASDLGRGYKALATAELDLRDGLDVLDLGCGPGADLSAYATAVGPSGSVLGLDHDAGAVARARALVSHLTTVRVEEADVHHLDLPDGSVDRAHTDRVLQHVADPGLVLAETFRVLRPGGRAVLAEPDWGTLVVDGPDAATSDAYGRFVVEQVVRNGRIGRRLAGLAERTGLVVERVVPVTAVFRDVRKADQVLGLARVARRAVEAGYLRERAKARWTEHLATQPFFASVTLFVVVADRPPA